MTLDLHAKLDELRGLPSETEWLEFKQNNDRNEEIGEYISALSNSAALHGQRAGWLVWGVEDQTLRIVGTNVDLKGAKGKGNEDLEPWLARLLEPRIDFIVHPPVSTPGGRVVMVEIPAATSRPVISMDKRTCALVPTRSRCANTQTKNGNYGGSAWTGPLRSWSAQALRTLTLRPSRSRVSST